MERLTCESFPCREEFNDLAGDGVLDFLFVDELGTAVLEGGHISDAPADGEVDFLPLPVLNEDHRPQTIGNGEGEGVGGEEEEGRGANGGGSDEEGEVGLEKGKVECNLSEG